MFGARERYILGSHCGDVELLALVLGTMAGGRGTREVAGELIDRFGGVRGIATTPVVALTEVHGIGEARAIRIHAACALAARPRARIRPDRTVTSPDDAWLHLREGLEHLDVEELHALYLDRRGRPLARRRISVGNDASTIVDPRQVLRPAIQLGAASVIVAHNHPSGDPEPSDADLDVTRRLRAAAEVLGVRLLDHLVIGDGDFRRIDDLDEPEWGP
ncbi:MAG TPA: DNA repair protein RadC [Myxococcota bacterium]|nr:DNA repair protein RadC [Myxococcota bacterium]